jgi:hypothetical protein
MKPFGAWASVYSLRKTRMSVLFKTYILRQQYVLPKIQDIFPRHRNYKFFTKIDLSMQYYSFVLDGESSWLWCVFITIYGKY